MVGLQHADEMPTRSGVEARVELAEPALAVSSSVRRAITGLSDDEVTAAAVVEGILRLHPEYAHGRAQGFAMRTANPAVRRLAPAAWLRRVRALYRDDALQVL